MTPCAGCHRPSTMLHTVDDVQLCTGCTEKSARIDQLLVNVSGDDPVACDGCEDRVDFDARIAVVVRECGGAVFCDGCKAATAVVGACA